MKGQIRLFYVLLALTLGLTACSEKKEVHKVSWVTAPAYAVEDVAQLTLWTSFPLPSQAVRSSTSASSTEIVRVLLFI